MKTEFTATRPNEIQYTMTLTMSLGDWKLIQKNLDGNHPQDCLRREITSMVYQASKNFILEPKESQK